MWGTSACQALSKTLNVSSVIARTAPDLSETLEVLSNTTVRGFAVTRDDLKPYWKIKKKTIFFDVLHRSTILQVFQRLLNAERRLTSDFTVENYPILWNNNYLERI